MKTLNVGDVFDLIVGMESYVTIPEMFVYSNTPKSKKLTTTNVRIGDVLKPSIPNLKKFDTSIFVGEYVVESAFEGGGGSGGYGSHDDYPDGWYITARKLKNKKYDPNGSVISFYQNGPFNAVNNRVPAIRKMTLFFK